MVGAWGSGALISSFNPASSTALKVLLPNAPITVPFCLNFGRLSNKLFTPLGVKKQITSIFFLQQHFFYIVAVRTVHECECELTIISF